MRSLILSAALLAGFSITAPAFAQDAEAGQRVFNQCRACQCRQARHFGEEQEAPKGCPQDARIFESGDRACPRDAVGLAQKEHANGCHDTAETHQQKIT